MKKATLFVTALAFIAVTTTSCKKTYHCECSDGTSTFKGESKTGDKKTRDADKATCENANQGIVGISCKLVID